MPGHVTFSGHPAGLVGGAFSPPSRNRAAALSAPTRTEAEPTLGVMLGKRHPSVSATLSAQASALATARPQHDKVNVMIHPSEPELHRLLAVRGGQGAPVTCAACGCRLAATGDAWFHFNPLGGRDARGCRVACADAAHDTSGRAISVNV
jgi:hypothetical protein